jgi:hypothetical protein
MACYYREGSNPGSDVVINKITRKWILSTKSNLCHLGHQPFASGFFRTEAVMTDEILQSFHSPVNRRRGEIYCFYQCSGSGRFWASLIRIRNLFVRIRILLFCDFFMTFYL